MRDVHSCVNVGKLLHACVCMYASKVQRCVYMDDVSNMWVTGCVCMFVSTCACVHSGCFVCMSVCVREPVCVCMCVCVLMYV